MAEDTEAKFLIEGIRRYSSALDTIRAFETLLREQLQDVAKSYSHELFTPTKTPIKTGVNKGAWGQAIWASPEGMIRSRKGLVWLELGMWWQGSEVALYCNFVDAKSKVLDFVYSRNHSRVENRKWSSSARLFMLFDPAIGRPGLNNEFKLVLDELMISFE